MNQRFLESLVNSDGLHRVCGLRLHPFCFYDLLCLELAENALLLRHRDADWSDLLIAAKICSGEPGKWLKPMTRWARLGFWLWSIYIRRRYDIKAEAKKFADYCNDYDSRPAFWSSDAGAGELKAPWLLAIVTFVEDHSNSSWEEIMGAPAGLVWWKSAALAEQNKMSKSDLISDEDLAGMEALGLKP